MFCVTGGAYHGCWLAPPDSDGELIDLDMEALEVEPAGGRWSGFSATDREEADLRSAQLLKSLMTEVQISQYEFSGAFSLQTELGLFVLDKEARVHLIPKGQPDRELRLCVVPEDAESLPPADVLANLLLWLSSDPQGFLDVAVVIHDEQYWWPEESWWATSEACEEPVISTRVSCASPEFGPDSGGRMSETGGVAVLELESSEVDPSAPSPIRELLDACLHEIESQFGGR